MKIYDKNELTNSRIFFDKAPPRFMSYFLVSVIVLLVTLIGLATITAKTDVVQGFGTVEADDKVYLTPTISAKIATVFKQEGDLVTKGDVILTLEAPLSAIEAQEIDKQILYQTSQIATLNLAKQSLDEQYNYLMPEQAEFHGKISHYLRKVAAQETEKAIINEKKVQLGSRNHDQIEALEAEIKVLEKRQIGEEAQISALYDQLVNELGKIRAQVDNRLKELQFQQALKTAEVNNLQLKASQTGKLHYHTNIKQGMAISNMQPIAHIDQGNDAKLIIESYIPAEQISKISMGNEVRIAVLGVNQTKFGTLKGTIKRISSGTISRQKGAASLPFYQIIVDCDQDKLSHKAGEEIQLVPSLQVTTKIIYSQESYFQWLLEQLNFINK
ncbi:MAG: HlyD family secretion protein [Culicoidibacterales bacterium]